MFIGFKLKVLAPSACESTRSFYLINKMNENYDRHRRNIIIALSIITSILVTCSYNSGKDAPKARLVDTTDSCGINDAYYEIQDVDTTNDGYDTDSVIYLDANGNIIKSPLE